MKIRLFKKGDAVLIDSVPSFIEDINSHPIPDDLKNLEYCIVDSSNIPDGTCQEALYFDGSCNAKNLKIDTNWNKQLKPTWMIRKEEIDNCNLIIQSEIKKDSPDNNILTKNNTIINIIKNYDDFQLYQLALKNLDDRVASGEADKPNVRKKLQALIKQMDGK